MAVESLSDIVRAATSAFTGSDPTDITDTKPVLVRADKVLVLDSEAGDVPKLSTAGAVADTAISGVGGDSVDYVRLSADQAFGTTSLADVTGMALDLVANTDYKIELIGSFESAATGTGIQLALNVGGTVSRIAGQAYHPINASGGSAVIGQSANNAAVGISSGVNAANTPTALFGNWFVSMGDTGGAAQLRCHTEISASNITLQSGLIMRSHVLWAATVPAAFTAGQWTAAATATAGEISFDLTALPSNGGVPITALEYRVGTGAAIAFTGTGTGVRVVTAGLTAGVAADLQVRAVNAVGAGAWSDIKNRTPLAAGGGGVTYIGAGATYTEYSALTTHPVPVPAGMVAGQRLIMVAGDYGTITSAVTDEGQALAVDVIQAGSIWSVVLAGNVPTSITVTLSAASEFRAKTFVASGTTAVDSTANEDIIATPRATFDYTTTVASALVVVAYVRPDESVTAAQFNGADAANALAKFDFNNVGIVVGIHDGATGANTIANTWSAADTGGRYVLAVYR